MSRRLAPGTLVLLLALAIPPAATAVPPAFQVKDIKTTVDPTSPFRDNFPTVFVELGGAVYFTANDGVNGTEIWRSDGTAAGTHIVKDLCPGICGSRPYGLTRFGSSLYFENAVGATLWKSDGTAAGTVPVLTPPSPLASGFHFQPMRVLGSTLLLAGGDLGSQEGLWATDGTAAGTSLLKSFPGNGSADPTFLGQIGNTVLFSADDGTHGRELWTTDGTVAGTVLVRDLLPGPQGSLPGGILSPSQRAAVAGGKMFFAGIDPDHGEELWATDGTDAGTALVKDIVPGTNSSFVEYLTTLGDMVYFSAFSGDWQLWKSDGTAAGTVPVRTGLFGISEITVVGDRLFFQGTDFTHGTELWTSDGTTAGTVMVADINPTGSGLDGQGAGFFALGNRVVFFADDGSHGPEPWSSDGTAAGTILLADVNPGPGGSFGTGTDFSRVRGTALAGTGLFAAYGPAGWGLYATDGTPGGTSLLQALNTQASSLPSLLSPFGPPPFVDLGGAPLFQADDGTGAALWKSDGTAAGTALVKDVVFGGPWVSTLGTRAFFLAPGSNSGLWTSDGTTAGTVPVPASGASSTTDATGLTTFADKVLYFRFDSSTYELWRADPAGAGASLVQSLTPASGCCAAFARAAVGDFLYFLLPGFGSPLYRSDGTAAGTIQVAPGPFFGGAMTRIGAGPRVFFTSSLQPFVTDGTAAGTQALASVSLVFSPVVAGDKVFFAGTDFNPTGIELWVSDGTPAGTHLVKDILPGAGSAFPFDLTAVRDRVFFTADDGVHGRELWVSDGTDAGTHLVRDILPGSDSSEPQNLAGIGHLLFFAATDGVHDLEPWTSDGTAAGTRMLQDIAPGDLPSSPNGFTASGPYVYFAATDGTHGFEPWALPRAGLGGFLQATMTVGGQTREGGTVTYTLTVTNVGAGPHPDNPGDEVSDTLPTGLTLLSATAGSGTVTVDLPGNRAAWNGALDPGASVTITIQAQVAAGTFGTSLANQATLAFDADGDGTNESAGKSDDPGRPGTADATTFSPATSTLAFYTVTPCRVLDTRGGTPISGNAPRTLAIAGACGIPAGARAIAGNLTVVGPTAPGFLIVYPSGGATPFTSTLNFSPGQVRTNNAILALSGGKLDAQAGFSAGGQIDLLLDVVGYFQ